MRAKRGLLDTFAIIGLSAAIIALTLFNTQPSHVLHEELIMSQEPAATIPPTLTSLTADLRALGVTPGMTLLVHTSLRAISKWVIGGAQAVILALEAAIGPDGTLVMPTMTGDLTDPANWQNPPVPFAWKEVIRQEMPPFMPDLTVTRDMGVVAESFRKREGALRSSHPHTSFAAKGKHAAQIVANHRLETPLGDGSPLARIYELGGHVLLLGVGHGNNSSLHLAEERAHYPSKQMERNAAPLLIDGERRWVQFEIVVQSVEGFEQIGADFGRDTRLVRQGKVGEATSLLMPQPPLVDYAVRWMEKHRN
jgi:aminoglycoside 3-N-acetyltransferase